MGPTIKGEPVSEGQNSGGFVDKARDAARSNPDKARGVIDKAAGFLKKRAGDKHGSTIDKGADFVGDKLGVKEQKSQGGQQGRGDAEGRGGESGRGDGQRSE